MPQPYGRPLDYAAIRRTSVFMSEAHSQQETLALASMARDEPPASSTASSTAAAMRGKVGSEFETQISYAFPSQTDGQTDGH